MPRTGIKRETTQQAHVSMDDSEPEDSQYPHYLYIDTPEAAEELVGQILGDATRREVADVAMALAGSTDAGGRCPGAQDGRGTEAGPSLDLYNFMLLADTIHDFGDDFDVADILEWLPTPLLRVCSGVGRDKTWASIDLMEIKREDVLLRILTRSKYLHFASGRVVNPFWKKNVMKRYPYDPERSIADQARCVRKGFRTTSRVVTFEVWLEGIRDPRVLMLEHIARTCTTMRDLLGRDVEWVVDNSHDSMATLLTSFPLVHEALLNKFKTDPPSGFSKGLLARMNSRGPVTWTPIICDASLFDAGYVDRFVYEASTKLDRLRPKGFDTRGTGEVYVAGYEDQVELLGAEYRKDNKFYYKVRNGRSVVAVDAHRKQNSRPKMARDVEGRLENLEEGLVAREETFRRIRRAFAAKRAGDWGQVENCRIRGRAFMTNDKLAAMYAIYRGVTVVYVAVATHAAVRQVTYSLVRGHVRLQTQRGGTSRVRRHR